MNTDATGTPTPSPLEMVESVAPTDDVGARTADLFDWQAAMAAADGLALYKRRSDGGVRPAQDPTKIICEHHEDWVLVHEGSIELVSAKHREPSSGGWTTLKSLIQDGGVGHLFARWLMLGKTATSRVVTTAGLSGESAQDLQSVCQILGSSPDVSSDEGLVARVVTSARQAIEASSSCPKEWTGDVRDSVPVETRDADVRAFLAGLTFDQRSMSRTLVRHAAPTMFARPVLGTTRGDEALERASWEAVHDLFRERMRNAGDSDSGALPNVLSRSATPLTIGADLQSRTVLLTDIATALETAAANPLGYSPLTHRGSATRLSVKMARGGCHQTSIERAEDLRREYNDYWRLRREGVPGSAAEQRRVERRLHALADRSVNAARTELGDWGPAVWTDLDTTMESGFTGSPHDFAPDLALGGVAELTARCKVWFSDKFDVDSELARLRHEDD